jgi:hypothetical protein
MGNRQVKTRIDSVARDRNPANPPKERNLGGVGVLAPSTLPLCSKIPPIRRHLVDDVPRRRVQTRCFCHALILACLASPALAQPHTYTWAGDARHAARVDIRVPGTCKWQPNCDNSETLPIITVTDYLCFQQRFAAADAWADFDQDGRWTVADWYGYVAVAGGYVHPGRDPVEVEIGLSVGAGWYLGDDGRQTYRALIWAENREPAGLPVVSFWLHSSGWVAVVGGGRRWVVGR